MNSELKSAIRTADHNIPVSAVLKRSMIVYRFILILLILLTLVMISLGGATRLTGSGLSIVEWDLIMGTLPPLSDKDWQKKFEDYQKFPEYQILNFNMTLKEFKTIFYYEYLHRLLGRVLGLLTLLLLLVTFFGKPPKVKKSQVSILFILVSLQGFVGWYMVQSGLIGIPRVSHYRLLTHFLLAILYLSWLVYMLLQTYPHLKKTVPIFFHRMLLITFMVFIIQISFGSLLAGLDGGLVSYSYPQMFGQMIPKNLMTFPGSWADKIFDNAVFLNFFHRHWGVLTSLTLVITGFFALFIFSSTSFLLYLSIILIGLGLLQPLLGILTLTLQVPVSWAVVHQFTAVLTLVVILSLKTLSQEKKQI